MHAGSVINIYVFIYVHPDNERLVECLTVQHVHTHQANMYIGALWSSKSVIMCNGCNRK